jgi:hypothetical protein
MATQLRKFVNDLERVVAQVKIERAITISKGSIPNMEAYHQHCGHIKGMDYAVGMAKEMLNKLDDDEGDNNPLPEMTP